MRGFIIISSILLSGCAASAAGLYKTNIEQTIPSEKSAQVFATCVAELLLASNDVRTDGTRYWVLRMNGYGVPVVRWDFIPTETGSRAEARATVSVNRGDSKVQECA